MTSDVLILLKGRYALQKKVFWKKILKIYKETEAQNTNELNDTHIFLVEK
jgi:hypothetical protein